MKNRLHVALGMGAVLAFAACAGVIAASAAEPAASARTVEPVPVRITPIVLDEAALPVRVSGRLARRSEAMLSFKIGGVVATVQVRAGDAVQAGQELASLQPAEIDAQVAQARSGLAKVERDLARVRNLAEARVATAENLQDAQTAVEVAQAQLRIAEFNRRYAVIVAPAAGRILRRVAEPDEWVGPGQPVLGFAAEGDGWLLSGGVSDREAVGLVPGDMAAVTWLRDRLAARVLKVGDAVDPVTGMVPVEVLLAAAPVGARSGSVAEAWLQPQPVAPRPRVPASALLEGAGRRAFVFVVPSGAGTARRVDVEVEALNEHGAYLRRQAGLTADAAVVVNGAEFLTDGAPVRVAQP